LAQLSNLESQSILMAIFLLFMTGLTGSAHCIGMCGGLVVASTSGPKSNFIYQVGRLIGYVILGFFAGSIGSILKGLIGEKLSLILPALAIGLIFIFHALKSIFPSFKISLPSFKTQKVFSKVIFLKSQNLKAFSVGFLSILLPCGFLYGVTIAVGALQNPILSSLAMALFWLGTLPGLVFAPNIIKKVLKPISIKYPRMVPISFLTIGILTISIRIYHVYGQQAVNCH
tara:strand:- start:108775 stop:109461 length:687 start_codon:yes stop_codon:yes gene_type:complete